MRARYRRSSSSRTGILDLGSFSIITDDSINDLCLKYFSCFSDNEHIFIMLIVSVVFFSFWTHRVLAVSYALNPNREFSLSLSSFWTQYHRIPGLVGSPVREAGHLS